MQGSLNADLMYCNNIIKSYQDDFIILNIKTQFDDQQLKYDIDQLKTYIKKVINRNTNNIHSNFIDYTYIEKYVHSTIQYQKNDLIILHKNLSYIIEFIDFIIKQSNSLNDIQNSMINTLGIIKNICVDNITNNDIDLYDIISEIDICIAQYNE